MPNTRDVHTLDAVEVTGNSTRPKTKVTRPTTMMTMIKMRICTLHPHINKHTPHTHTHTNWADHAYYVPRHMQFNWIAFISQKFMQATKLWLKNRIWHVCAFPHIATDSASIVSFFGNDRIQREEMMTMTDKSVQNVWIRGGDREGATAIRIIWTVNSASILWWFRHKINRYFTYRRSAPTIE